MKKSYSAEIANVVNTFLTEDDWNFDFDEDRGLFKFNLRLKGKIQKINYVVTIRDDDMTVYAICPINADRDDPEMMARMAEFICRSTYNMANGNFELDFRDGELRFKSFIDCDGCLPSTEIVKNSICCAAAMFKRYAAGIIGVIFGGMSTEEAVEMCENPKADAAVRRALEALTADVADGDVAEMLEQLAARMGMPDSADADAGDEETA